MDILILFNTFTNDILSLKIFNIPIYVYLITLTLISIVFLAIKNMSNK